MTVAGVLDVLAAIFLLAGAALTLIAGLGIVRFPEVMTRLHAGAKPQVLGLVLMLTAEALRVRSWAVVGLLVVIVTFQFLTVPVAAHLVARAAYRTNAVSRASLVVDELARDQSRARREARASKSDAPASDNSDR